LVYREREAWGLQRLEQPWRHPAWTWVLVSLREPGRQVLQRQQEQASPAWRELHRWVVVWLQLNAEPHLLDAAVWLAVPQAQRPQARMSAPLLPAEA
jgi:hypothetical protein